jgi:cation diffusion facilitator family transporter
MRKLSKVASVVNVVFNLFLFVIKIVVGFVFSSVSIIADSFNSLSDIIASVFIYVSVRINDESPDDNHEFGHSRAENIAGYTIGILMIVLGFSVIKMSVDKVIYAEIPVYSSYMLYVVFITFFVKLFLFVFTSYVLRKENSPALKANMRDHLNDMVIILGVLVAIVSIRYGYYFADSLVGFLIGLFIIKGGYDISKENVHYLMGVPADRKVIRKIKDVVKGMSKVESIDFIRSQYLGNRVQVEVHISVDKNLSLEESHDIGDKVKERVEEIDDVNDCFVHLNPK